MSYEIPVEAGKIRAFARAVHSRDEADDGREAIVTPTFLTTARNTWQPAEDSPLAGITLDLRRVLHAEEELRFHRRVPRAGETLTVPARIGAEWTREGRRGPDDVLTCSGTVTAVRDGEVDVDLTCTRQTGGVAISGSATFATLAT